MTFKQLSNFDYECFVDNNELEERGIIKEPSSLNSTSVGTLIDDCIKQLKTDVGVILAGEPVFQCNFIKEGLYIKFSWIKVLPKVTSDPNIAAGLFANTTYGPEASAGTDFIGDMLSALGRGDVINELSKYLNKDFLQELINASSTDTLESVINNFLDTFADSKASNAVEASIAKVSPEDYKKRMEKYIEKTDRIRGLTPENEKKQEHEDPALVMIDFRSLDEVETFIEKNDLKRFNLQSLLTKSREGYYHLILDMGELTPVTLADILVKFISLDNAAIISAPNLWSIKEHEEILIPSEAIEKLS